MLVNYKLSVNSRAYSDLSEWNRIVTYDPVHPLSDGYIEQLATKGGYTSDPTQYSYPVYEADHRIVPVPIKVSGNVSWIEPATGNGKRSSYGKGQLCVPVTSEMTPSFSSIPWDRDNSIIVLWRDYEFGMWRYDPEARTCTNGYWCKRSGLGTPLNCTTPDVGTNSFASRGAGVTFLGGLVRRWELEQGHIDHAIALAIRNPSPEHVGFATKSDGNGTHPFDLPEGARGRLRADFPLQGLSPIQQIIAQALKLYGFVIIDRSGRNKFIFEQSCSDGELVTAETCSFVTAEDFDILAWE